jgi:hypothetical protein
MERVDAKKAFNLLPRENIATPHSHIIPKCIQFKARNKEVNGDALGCTNNKL